MADDFDKYKNITVRFQISTLEDFRILAKKIGGGVTFTAYLHTRMCAWINRPENLEIIRKHKEEKAKK